MWVAEYQNPGKDLRDWVVFDPEGRLLGSVTMPERFTVYQIDARFVLGLRTDELGVERVELFELVKGQG